MNFLNKLERKYGRYAIRNLPAVIIALYVAGYLVSMMYPQLLSYLTLEPHYILRGQVWRLISWVLVPPSSLDIFTIIMLFFYYSIGKALERTWGPFLFNLYIFSGMIFTVLGAFLLYWLTGGMYGFGFIFSTYYINMSIFLAFALSYPDAQVMLYFIIPIKMKWMGLLYGFFIIYNFIQSGWAVRTAIICSLLNFLIYFFLTRKRGPVRSWQVHRQPSGGPRRPRTAGHSRPGTGTASSGQSGPAKIPMHRCTVCGRTELDDPSLEFRYCSKCAGSHEYCQDHLFTHEHIKID